MRTVEQVVKDFKDADNAVKQAEAARSKYREELQQIYNAAKDALGVKDQPLFR